MKMSSDNYAQHIIQKCRLAVAIGIIQAKPQSKSLDDYINDLKSKIDDKMDEMTICSDDFDIECNELADLDQQLDISQHSDTILKDFNEVHVSSNDEFGHTSRERVFVGSQEDTHVQIHNDENYTQTTFCDTQAQSNIYITSESLTDIDKMFCDSLAIINRDELIAIDRTCDNITKIDKIPMTIDKHVHTNQTIDTDKTYCDSRVKINENTTEYDEITVCESISNIKRQHGKNAQNKDKVRQYLDQATEFDSQTTELYTLHTLTEGHTHVSQSQPNEFNVSNRFIKGVRKSNGNPDLCKSVGYNMPAHVDNIELQNNIKDVLVGKINRNLDKIVNAVQRETEKSIQNTEIATSTSIFNNENAVNNIQENTDFCYNIKDINLVKKINNKLHEMNAVVTDNIRRDTQIAVDINNLTNIDKKAQNIRETETDTEFEYNLKDLNLVRKVCYNLDKDKYNMAMETDDNVDLSTQVDLNILRNDNYTEETPDQFTYINANKMLSNPFDTNIIQNTVTLQDISKTTNENMTMQVFNTTQNNQDLFLTENNNTINTDKYTSKINVPNTEYMTLQIIDYGHDVKRVENDNITNSANEISKTNVQNTTQDFNLTEKVSKSPNERNLENYLENDSTSSEELSELVPFKVMEELNRVKAFLNRRLERRMSTESSLDSGYRSDSQGRSRSALQLSGNWIGQSAYCLYEYITRCPMVATTREIVDEISQVLGQLIDKLHEEESYPSFLEELLEHVNTLIRSIFTDEDMLLEKDEKIQRLFLLNKSTHIQKYSIEKLTDILENIHTSLTSKEDLHELTDIQEVENVSYIFHTLEIIIKKYLKNKKIDGSQSQNTENQKRTSISDIWRRKWNPNFKEETKLDVSLDRKCVLTKCSEVLNKIVVGCLDGYSLVAFAALQCFNLLQP